MIEYTIKHADVFEQPDEITLTCVAKEDIYYAQMSSIIQKEHLNTDDYWKLATEMLRTCVHNIQKRKKL